MESRLEDFNFTVHNDCDINRIIASQIREVTKHVLTQSKDVVSLILVGGYARGEGSVLMQSEGLVPLGDYDFLIVSNFPHPTTPSILGIESLQSKFHLQYHIGVDRAWKFRLPTVNKRIYWYEVKFGGRVLYGNERILDLIPISNGREIELSEGPSLIFNRLTGMLLHFDPDFCINGTTCEKKEDLIFQSVKGILACGESLLVLSGKYHFSYQKRGELFSRSFRSDFPQLATDNYSLKEDFEKATSFKMRPSYGMYGDPVELWFTAKKHILSTLSFYVNGQKTNSRNSTSTQLSPNRSKDLPSLFLIRSKPELMDFLTFNLHALKYRPSVRGLLPRRSSFSDIARASLLFLTLSMKESGDVDKDLLARALRTVSSITQVPKEVVRERNLNEKWRRSRNIVIGVWSLCRP